MAGPIFVLVTLTCISILVSRFLANLSYKRRRNGALPVPGPKGVPVLGNVFDMPKDSQLIPLFNKWNREYGDMVQFNIMGVNQIVLNTEKATNDLFVQRGNHYSDRGAPTAVNAIAKGRVTALMNRSSIWREQRKLLHTVLAAPATTQYEPWIELETVYTLYDLLNSPENFSKHLERYAYGIIGRVGYGRKFDDINDPVVQESLISTTEILSAFRPDKFACNVWPLLGQAPDWLVPSNKSLRMILARIERLKDGIIGDLKADMRDGIAPPSQHKWYIEHVDEFDMTEEHGAWVFQAFLSAGTRSPFNALMSHVIAMMQHPEWQLKIQAEVDEVVGKDRFPSFKDMPNLPTVRAVIKEGIRWRSIVAEIGIPHKVNQDDIYNGYFIPKGTILHANYSSILTEPELYPDGAVYNPARWIDPSYPTYKEPLTSFPTLQGFTSFGYGRRACPASHFTERTLTVMVARLAWAFDIKRAVDPKTGDLLPLNIEYEPVPNPSPLPFPSTFVVRDPKRAEIIKRHEMKERMADPLSRKGKP